MITEQTQRIANNITDNQNNQRMRAGSILETIGQTPHVKINRLYGEGHDVWIKLERNNPGNSIKDRIALSMIEDAEKKGILNIKEALLLWKEKDKIF